MFTKFNKLEGQNANYSSAKHSNNSLQNDTNYKLASELT